MIYLLLLFFHIQSLKGWVSHTLNIAQTRMHSSRKRTVRSSSRWGWSPPDIPLEQTHPPPSPLTLGTSWKQTPPQEQSPRRIRHTPPRADTPLGAGTPPADRILDTRFWKYYLSQTSFAGGKYDVWKPIDNRDAFLIVKAHSHSAIFVNATAIWKMGCVDVFETVHMVRLWCICVCDVTHE